MRRNARIIQINGFRGLLTALFIITCLAAGFIAFPGFVAMNIWNYFAGSNVPQINLYQGILLWAIIFLTYFIATKQRVAVSFATPKELNEEELKTLMERVKMQSQARMINKMILKNLEENEKISQNASDNQINKETKL